ncbi:MAG: hypothetical protein WBM65_12200, partial [Sedimenticolaceae bacterium]
MQCNSSQEADVLPKMFYDGSVSSPVVHVDPVQTSLLTLISLPAYVSCVLVTDPCLSELVRLRLAADLVVSITGAFGHQRT